MAAVLANILKEHNILWSVGHMASTISVALTQHCTEGQSNHRQCRNERVRMCPKILFSLPTSADCLGSLCL